MNPEPLMDAAGLVADGTPFDLREVSSGLSTDHDRELADELAVVARIAEAHRQLHVLLTPAAFPAEPTLHAATWGHLELIEVVGRGSYGTVYRAWDPRLDRHVALKLFHNASNPEAVMREGRMLARIRHENVVHVYGADVFDGVAGIWMEFVRGRSLDRIIEAQGALSAREATQIGIDVARALAAVHGAGFFHCDVKAQNVVRESGGRIVLMDLGAGRASTAGDSTAKLQVAGTPRYMPPELFDAGRALPQSDVYSVGVLLYHLVSRRFPVDGKTLSEIRAAHKEGRRDHLRDVRPDLPSGFLREVTRALDPVPAQRHKTAGDLEASLLSIETPEARRLHIPKRIWIASAVVALLVAAVAGISNLWPPAQPHSIAVLPILNLTGDPGKAYIADGLTQVLISNLARIRAFSVPSFAAVAEFRDDKEPSRIVAGKLGVRFLIRGSILQVGDRARISVQLIDPETDTVEWGDELTRDSSELIAAQAEIARLVAAQLSLRLSPDEVQGLKPTAIDPRAHDLYLQALATSQAPELSSLQLTARLFQEVIDIAPGFAPAWAKLALAEIRLINRSGTVVRSQGAQRSKELATHALKLDPGLADAYFALGTIQFLYDWDFAAAERSFRAGLQLSRSDAVNLQRFATMLAAQGRLDEAIALSRAGRDHEPLLPINSTSLGFVYYYARDYANAEAEMTRALQVRSGFPGAHFGLGRIYSALGRQAEAIHQIEQAVKQSPISGYLVELARVHAAAGNKDRVKEILAQLADREKAGEIYSLDNLGYIAAAEGRIDEAFAILNQAVDQRLTNVVFVGVDPRVDPLRKDPRFQQLLARIGLHR